MDYSKLTLGELLSSKNKIIRRNAISILKEFQRTIGAIIEPEEYGKCDTCGKLTYYYAVVNHKRAYYCDNCET